MREPDLGVGVDQGRDPVLKMRGDEALPRGAADGGAGHAVVRGGLDAVRVAALLAPLPHVEGAEDPHRAAGSGRVVFWHAALAAAVDATGFCLFAAAALLAENSAPTEPQVRTALAGNICRCGTYPRILAAVQTAAEELR